MLNLTVLDDNLSIIRLSHEDKFPLFMFDSPFYSITKTSDELSIVLNTETLENQKDLKLLFPTLKIENNWKAIKVIGPLPFHLTGILASIANPLAQLEISIFAISTYDTDYILIKQDKLELAISALKASHFIFPSA